MTIPAVLRRSGRRRRTPVVCTNPSNVVGSRLLRRGPVVDVLRASLFGHLTPLLIYTSRERTLQGDSTEGPYKGTLKGTLQRDSTEDSTEGTLQGTTEGTLQMDSTEGLYRRLYRGTLEGIYKETLQRGPYKGLYRGILHMGPYKGLYRGEDLSSTSLVKFSTQRTLRGTLHVQRGPTRDSTQRTLQRTPQSL